MNAQEIINRLKERYPIGDGWITMAEVTPPGCKRRFDLISIMGWSSRGHEAMGFEVKVARSDWLAELANPAKAEPLVKLCSRYWIVAPPGVVVKDEMPAAWGLLTVHPEMIRADKQAPNLNPEPWTDAVWRCMLLRCGTRERHSIDDLAKAKHEGYREGYAAGEKQAETMTTNWEQEWEALREQVDNAQKATGVHIGKWTDWPELGEAMTMIREARAGHHSHQVERIRRDAESLRSAAAAMEKAADALTPKQEEAT